MSRKKPENFIELARKQSPPADQAILADPETYKMLLETWKENLRVDARGYVDDARLLMEDWGIDPGSIRQTVRLVWGEEDRNTPVSVVDYFREQLPASELHLLPNEGHFGFLRQWGLMLDLLTA